MKRWTRLFCAALVICLFTAMMMSLVPPAKAEIKNLEVWFEGFKTVDGVNYLSGDEATLRWSVSGEVSVFYVRVLDSSGALAFPPTDFSSVQWTSRSWPLSLIREGELYTAIVYALPRGAKSRYDPSVVSATIQFMVGDASPASPTLSDLNVWFDGFQPIGDIYYFSDLSGGEVTLTWSVSGEVSAFYVRVLDSSGALAFPATDYSSSTWNSRSWPLSLIREGELYTATVFALPRGAARRDDPGTITAKVQFMKFESTIGADSSEPETLPDSDLAAYVDGVPLGDDPVMLEPGAFTVSWNAQFDYSSVFLYLFDDTERYLFDRNIGRVDQFVLDTRGMNRKSEYTVQVGAKPAGGGDIVWASGRVALGGADPLLSEEILDADGAPLGWVESFPVESPAAAEAETGLRLPLPEFLGGRELSALEALVFDAAEYPGAADDSYAGVVAVYRDASGGRELKLRVGTQAKFRPDFDVVYLDPQGVFQNIAYLFCLYGEEDRYSSATWSQNGLAVELRSEADPLTREEINALANEIVRLY